MKRSPRSAALAWYPVPLAALAALALVVACAGPREAAPPAMVPGTGMEAEPAVPDEAVATAGEMAPRAREMAAGEGWTEAERAKILRGRTLTIQHACGGCHGGGDDPSAENWLVGLTSPEQEFRICVPGGEEGAEPVCYRTRPRNLTPDNITGMGRFSERQIFNALRYGLRPGETEDAEITSATPGEGGFPEHPKFLAPPMPWPAWRHMTDDELWAIAAYLKRGVKPVRNVVQDSEGPMDFWASLYGRFLPPYPAAAFPTARETEPPPGVDRSRVLRGRQVVIEHDCGACHGGGVDPASESWMVGITDPGGAFPVGACVADPEAEPCYMMRPDNLTPHGATGIGEYTDRQLFNAIRYGLRPSRTPDVEVTSTTPGEGGHPAEPQYLGPGMPWTQWRHMPDEDIWALVAYLKHGLRPVENQVADSDAPEDSWVSEYAPGEIGSWPAPPFPTEREVGG